MSVEQLHVNFCERAIRENIKGDKCNIKIWNQETSVDFKNHVMSWNHINTLNKLYIFAGIFNYLNLFFQCSLNIDRMMNAHHFIFCFVLCKHVCHKQLSKIITLFT